MAQKISWGADGELRFEDDVQTVQRKLDALVRGTFSDYVVNLGWLSAGETWTFAADDDPTYTFTIAAFDATTKYWPGMRVKLTDSGVQFGIITKVVFDDPGSTITIYMGTDYDLSGGAITLPFYSLAKAPIDFPMDRSKWTLITEDATQRSQAAPNQFQWYNINATSLVIHIGIWDVDWTVCFANGTGAKSVYVTLSTTNNSETDPSNTFGLVPISGSEMNIGFKRQQIEIATKTTHYINTQTGHAGSGTLFNLNQQTPLVLRAASAYL